MMFEPVRELIFVPACENEARAFLDALAITHSDVSERVRELQAANFPARAILKYLIEDGNFDLMSETEANSFEREFERSDYDDQSIANYEN